MGVLLAFFAGWAAGAKVGNKGYNEVVAAVKTVQQSEEFASLLVIGRSQCASALKALSKLVSGEEALPAPADLLERVQRLTGQRPT